MTPKQLAQVTRQIKVSVTPYFIEQRVVDNEPHYLFGYKIIISNNSNYPIQLLRRHWIITDSNGQQIEVKGEGVIGLQPIISSLGHFEYSSGSHFKTPVGTMHGEYTMRVEGDQTISVTISPFLLSVQGIIH